MLDRKCLKDTVSLSHNGFPGERTNAVALFIQFIQRQFPFKFCSDPSHNKRPMKNTYSCVKALTSLVIFGLSWCSLFFLKEHLPALYNLFVSVGAKLKRPRYSVKKGNGGYRTYKRIGDTLYISKLYHVHLVHIFSNTFLLWAIITSETSVRSNIRSINLYFLRLYQVYERKKKKTA